ncbi:MAG: hypothetical protein ACPG21_02505 [Crocinitomicaceae bacterium]
MRFAKDHIINARNERMLNILALLLLLYSIYAFFVFFDGISKEEGPYVYQRFFWKWHYALVLAMVSNLAAVGIYTRRSFGWITGLPLCLVGIFEGIRILTSSQINGLDLFGWNWLILLVLTFVFIGAGVLLILGKVRGRFDVSRQDAIVMLLVLITLVIDNPILNPFLS